MPVRRENVAAALKYLQDKADLRGRAERALSLDPQKQDLADIAVEGIASLAPGVAPALAARDVERARRANDPAGMAMASMGAIPGGRLAKLLKGFDPTQKIAPALEKIEPVTTAVEIPEALHGSPVRGLTELSPSKAMEVRGATWFSDNADIADQYTFPREYGEILYDAEPGEIYKAGLSFKNPLTVDFKGKVGDAIELSKLVEQAKKQGYDGLIVRNVDDSIDSSKVLGTSYAVFDRNQIKLKK